MYLKFNSVMSIMIGEEQNAVEEYETSILPKHRGNDVQMKACEMPELRDTTVRL